MNSKIQKQKGTVAFLAWLLCILYALPALFPPVPFMEDLNFKLYDLIPYIYYYENSVYVLYDPDVNDGGYAKRGAEQSEIPFVGSIDKRCLKYKDTKTVIGDYDGLAYARMVSKLADKLYKPISRVFTAQDAEGKAINPEIFIYIDLEVKTLGDSLFPKKSPNKYGFRFARVEKFDCRYLKRPKTWSQYEKWTNECLLELVKQAGLYDPNYVYCIDRVTTIYAPDSLRPC